LPLVEGICYSDSYKRYRRPNKPDVSIGLAVAYGGESAVGLFLVTLLSGYTNWLRLVTSIRSEDIFSNNLILYRKEDVIPISSSFKY
jgi:hypothetical protein